MKASAPLEIVQIGLDPSRFHYSDKKSFRGPCPQCGGTRRFVIFTDHEWPLLHGYCDQCGYKIKAWERVKYHPDPAKLEAYRREQEAEERMEAEARNLKLAEFTTAELWNELHARMTDEHIVWWENNGIPRGLQDYLHIGYNPDKAYYDDEKVLRHSPAFTIPWFGPGFQFLTMQYRLMNDTDRRYIFEDGLGGGRHFYMTEPDQPIRDKVIICEGAKKAIVTQFWLSEGFTVLAASSANTFDAALEATKDCGLRYLIFDPDVKAYWRQKAIATNPKTTREIRLLAKVDDMFLKYDLDRNRFMKILETSL